MQNRFQHVQNIIFDMDGTLIQTALATISACQETAQAQNLPIPSAEAVTRAIGYSGLDFYKQFLPTLEGSMLEQYAQATDTRESAVIRTIGAGMLYDGALALLETLSNAGYDLTIASTGSTDHVETALINAGIRHFFRMIQCNSADKATMVKAIMQGGTDGEWLIIGDRLSDCNAGRANSILTVAARYGYGNDAEYAQFDAGVDSAQGLLALLTI